MIKIIATLAAGVMLASGCSSTRAAPKTSSHPIATPSVSTSDSPKTSSHPVATPSVSTSDSVTPLPEIPASQNNAGETVLPGATAQPFAAITLKDWVVTVTRVEMHATSPYTPPPGYQNVLVHMTATNTCKGRVADSNSSVGGATTLLPCDNNCFDSTVLPPSPDGTTQIGWGCKFPEENTKINDSDGKMWRTDDYQSLRTTGWEDSVPAGGTYSGDIPFTVPDSVSVLYVGLNSYSECVMCEPSIDSEVMIKVS